MALSAGTRFGPYEVGDLLGSGDAGDVYQARDTRLNRSIAIRVLDERFLPGASDRRRQFEREARAVSSLSHAHICSLYDVGHQDGHDFLVLEYLEGESLAVRLGKGALPPDEAQRVLVEVAAALHLAHRQGIVTGT